MTNYSTQAKDAELRAQIVGSCRVINRHLEGLVIDTASIIAMPTYKTECEDAINRAERTIELAAQAIKSVKDQMGKKQLQAT